MKVVENSPARLRMTEFPWGLTLALLLVMAVPAGMSWGYFRAGVPSGGYALAAIALLLLVGCFGVFVKQRSITLDRGAGQVEVVECGIFGARRRQFSMSGLRGASVQTTIIRERREIRSKDDALRLGGRHKLRNVRAFRPQLVFESGRTEPLTEIYASDASASLTATAINGWMGADALPAAAASGP